MACRVFQRKASTSPYNWRRFAFEHNDEKRRQMRAQMTAVTHRSLQNQLSRYGWQPMFLSGDEFSAYLAEQEILLTDVMASLGLIRR